MYWSQTESSKWSLYSLSFHPRHPFSGRGSTATVRYPRRALVRQNKYPGGLSPRPEAKAKPQRPQSKLKVQGSSADLLIDGAEVLQEALEHVQPVGEVLDAHHLAHLVGVRVSGQGWGQG
eukprot:scaffold121705_cov60-Phaeocystis_antarctica.AAC.1